MAMGLGRSDFWDMSPDELGEWYNANRPRKSYGRLSESEAQSLTDRINANPDKYA